MVFDIECFKRRFALLEASLLITKEELKRIADLNNIPLFTQERDYVENLFLFRLYSLEEAKNFVFKGGTCLKLLYNSNRFSEDLDFVVIDKFDSSIIEKVVDSLKLIGIEGKVNNKKTLKQGFTCRVRYKGPLYTGKPLSMGSIRIDISLRKDLFLEPEWKLVTTPYPDIRSFSVLCMDLKEIFAEKIRSLITRAKPRDFYDVWFLFQKAGLPSLELINKKCKVVGKTFDKNKVSFRINKKEWFRDLELLLPQKVDVDSIQIQLKKFWNEAKFE